MSQSWLNKTLARVRALWKWVAATALLMVLVAMLLSWLQVDLGGMIEAIRRWLEHLNPVAFFAAIALLPVVGLSVMLTYVVAGAKFGALGGLAVVAGATAVHLVLTHVFARGVLQRPLQWLVKRRGYKIPTAGGHELSVVAIAALVPGLPYFVRNYLLALSGIPLRRYFPLCWLIYVVRSGVTIFLGDWSDSLTPGHVAILASVWAVKLTICALLVRHLLRARPRVRG